MKLLTDLFSTDYGLMGINGIAFMRCRWSSSFACFWARSTKVPQPAHPCKQGQAPGHSAPTDHRRPHLGVLEQPGAPACGLTWRPCHP
jgi:hypothetical protein